MNQVFNQTAQELGKKYDVVPCAGGGYQVWGPNLAGVKGLMVTIQPVTAVALDPHAATHSQLLEIKRVLCAHGLEVL